LCIVSVVLCNLTVLLIIMTISKAKQHYIQNRTIISCVCNVLIQYTMLSKIIKQQLISYDLLNFFCGNGIDHEINHLNIFFIWFVLINPTNSSCGWCLWDKATSGLVNWRINCSQSSITLIPIFSIVNKSNHISWLLSLKKLKVGFCVG